MSPDVSPDVSREAPQERSRRLFFALWPDEVMQTALADVTRAIVSSSDGTPIPARNFHFTLAFLGAVPESRVAALDALAARVASAFQASVAAGNDAAPLTITLDRIDHWRRSAILCATPSIEPPEAIALAKTLARLLTETGFVPDARTSQPAGDAHVLPFRPHVTLARKASRPVPPIKIDALAWGFTEFALIQSERSAQGSVYTRVQSYPLISSR